MKDNDKDIKIPEAYAGRAYMRRRDCADASGLSVAYFDRLAWQEQPPKFIKTSPRGAALYPVREFFDWLHSLSKA